MLFSMAGHRALYRHTCVEVFPCATANVGDNFSANSKCARDLELA
jgi:hypothetical protein